MSEWTLFFSRTRRKRIKRRQKQIKIDIPLLLNKWPNAMNEIITYLPNQSLIRLSQTSTLMKRSCEKEIKVRKEHKRFQRNKKEILESLESHPLYCFIRDEYDYEEREKEKEKCDCGGWEEDAKDYDPDCPGKDGHNWGIQAKEYEKEVKREIALNVLFYPKLKYSIW